MKWEIGRKFDKKRREEIAPVLRVRVGNNRKKNIPRKGFSSILEFPGRKKYPTPLEYDVQIISSISQTKGIEYIKLGPGFGAVVGFMRILGVSPSHPWKCVKVEAKARKVSRRYDCGA